MKDTELRMVVLQWYYDHRRSAMIRPGEDLPADHLEAIRICVDLNKLGLLEWSGVSSQGVPAAGFGHITPEGINVIENPVRYPEITQNVTIINSQVQIGDHNQQNMTMVFQNILDQIDKSTCTDEEKREAKNLLARLIEHPLLNTIIGAVLSSLLKS